MFQAEVVRFFLIMFRTLLTLSPLGTSPSGSVHPLAIKVMKEKGGLDISDSKSKQVSTAEVLASDYVISMGCLDASFLPDTFRGIFQDWDVLDPAKENYDFFVTTYETIYRKCQAFLATLSASSSSSSSLSSASSASSSASSSSGSAVSSSSLPSSSLPDSSHRSLNIASSNNDTVPLLSSPDQPASLNLFEKYLSLWILLALVRTLLPWVF
jgi:hypothetical protein